MGSGALAAANRQALSSGSLRRLPPMRGVVRSSVVRKIVLAGLVASIVPAVAYGREAAAGGELILCSASGVRVATGTFTFTLVTVASAGGTTTLNVPVGACTGRLFYPVGVSLTVSENVPAGFAVTGITLNPTPGGSGTTSVITSNTPRPDLPSSRSGAGRPRSPLRPTGRQALRASARCRTSSASLSRPRRPLSAKRIAPSGPCARSTPTSTTPGSSTAKARRGAQFSRPAPPSSSRSASAGDHSRSRLTPLSAWLSGIRASDSSRKAHTGFEPVPPP